MNIQMKRILSILTVILSITLSACGQDMKLQEGLALKYLVQMPAQKSQHPPVIIIMHGYGSDEKDMFALRKVLPANYLIIAARAPFALPQGGYQWFEPDRTSGKYNGKKEDLDKSRELVAAFIGQVISKYSADAKQVYLMGFSQGAIMSYEVGLTHPSALKGIGVLSGVLFPSLKPLIKVTPTLKQLKIFIAHGTADDRLSFAEGKAAYDYLKSIGLNPEFHQYPGMGHTITNDVITNLVNWMK